MIRNWTVTTQAVKNGADGLACRERYLTSKTHPNHRKTEAIISIAGSAKTTSKIALVGQEFKLKQKLTGKGGRPLSSMAMEFCLSLPKGMRPSPEQWHLIAKDCTKALAVKLRLTKPEAADFFGQVRAVLHQQAQTGQSGSGDHLHIIYGKVLHGRVLKELQRKEMTKTLKLAFNAAVLTHYGADHREYKAYELNRGKRLEKWQYVTQQFEVALEEQKLVKKMQTQAGKWFAAFETGNSTQLNRQFNRLAKTFQSLLSIELDELLAQEVSRVRTSIEVKSQRKF